MRFGLWGGPFRGVKRLVWHHETARFKGQNGPFGRTERA